ncbi:hypothetical protein BC2230_21128 [Burkholderia cepacia]
MYKSLGKSTGAGQGALWGGSQIFSCF